MLLDHRLIFVTGKGGVGKSTVAQALGMVAARQGRRTVVVGLEGEDHVFRERQLGERLFSITIDPEHAMEEYLRVKGGPLGGALAHSRLFQTLVMATPGMRELLVVGKVWELAQPARRTRGADPYDTVIVDAPATGHGLATLRAPGTFAEAAKVGPIAHQGATIASTLADRSFTAVVGVARPEEMPVNETFQLEESLRSDGRELDAVILNGCYPVRFDAEAVRRIEERLDGAGDRTTRAALRAALSEHERVGVQEQQRTRLKQAFADRLHDLPYLFGAELDARALGVLAERLAEAL